MLPELVLLGSETLKFHFILNSKQIQLMCGQLELFFSCAESDLHALAEIISIFGLREYKNIVHKLGITITSSENICGCGVEVFYNRIWKHDNDNGLMDQLIALVKNLLNIDGSSPISSLHSNVFKINY